MKKGLILSLFVLGLSSVVAQVVVLRELTISFYGNEFFMAVILASWLAWVALGSGLAGKILNRLPKTRPVLLALHLLIGVLFFGEIIFIRWVKTWFGFAGEVPNLLMSLAGAWLIPASWAKAKQKFSPSNYILV